MESSPPHGCVAAMKERERERERGGVRVGGKLNSAEKEIGDRVM